MDNYYFLETGQLLIKYAKVSGGFKISYIMNDMVRKRIEEIRQLFLFRRWSFTLKNRLLAWNVLQSILSAMKWEKNNITHIFLSGYIFSLSPFRIEYLILGIGTQYYLLKNHLEDAQIDWWFLHWQNTLRTGLMRHYGYWKLKWIHTLLNNIIYFIHRVIL